MESPISNFISKLKSDSINFIAFCYTDFSGKLNKVTYCLNEFDEKLLEHGIPIDLNLIDKMSYYDPTQFTLIPDLSTAFLDPFSTQTCSMVMCNIENHESRLNLLDSRIILRTVEQQYLNDLNIFSNASIHVGMKFFIFDEVKFNTDSNYSYYKIKIDQNIDVGNQFTKLPHMDNLFDIRAEICSAIESVGINAISHQYLNSPGHCKINFKCNTFFESADTIQKFKYIAKNVAASYGKALTFMPTPLTSTKASSNIIYEINASEASQTPEDHADNKLFFAGGIYKHVQAINAFSNSTTNSYKRLPDNGKEFRENLQKFKMNFIDCVSNPYTALAAIILAGIDGVKNKISLNDFSDDKKNSLFCSSSLSDSLLALNNNRDFLIVDDVFNNEFIDEYIKFKSKEIQEIASTINPAEFQFCY